MSSDIFERLLKEQIESFCEAYINVSKDTFTRDDSLIHPYEYGRYREMIVLKLLRLLMPNRIAGGDGFIISSKNDVSTQCDIVLFDDLLTPRIQSKEMQRFFPIETVVGVIEVKSKLKKCDLENTLLKLSKVKKIRENIDYPSVERRDSKLTNHKFDPVKYNKDNIFTAVICEEFDFKLDHVAADVDNMYNSKIESHQKHNIILSIKDGILLYDLSACCELEKEIQNLDKTIVATPKYKGVDLTSKFGVASGTNSHIKNFLNYFSRAMVDTSILFPEIMLYSEGFNTAIIDRER